MIGARNIAQVVLMSIALQGILNILRGRTMDNYIQVIVCHNLKDTIEMCRKFMRAHNIEKVERFGQANYRFISEGKEYAIMNHLDYEQWCKGKTYIKDGKLMHSGYELKEQSNE